ncbi:MAG: 16S rRNA (uracil(1498)-N(3))-methyltransferase [Treponema sp.]|nr:16S rRNA (uracil(1498)-N(3))-methyltransferase [Treponema sp.]
MKQFILTEEPDVDNTVRLKGSDYRYLVRVRRLAAGEFFPAVLPNGREALVQALSIEGGVLTGKCVTPDNAAVTESKLPPIILFQAMPKSDKMDTIVRQAAEGGITEIVPFVSEFSIAKTGACGQKFPRWQRIVREARQQSGSRIQTSIRHPMTINELFEYWKNIKQTGSPSGAFGLLFHHQGIEQKSLHSYLNNVPSVAALAVGPEGGFSGVEVSLFLENGFKPITIGDTVLRTETAALYCAAAVRILLLEKDSWELKQAKRK